MKDDELDETLDDGGENEEVVERGMKLELDCIALVELDGAVDDEKLGVLTGEDVPELEDDETMLDGDELAAVVLEGTPLEDELGGGAALDDELVGATILEVELLGETELDWATLLEERLLEDGMLEELEDAVAELEGCAVEEIELEVDARTGETCALEDDDAATGVVEEDGVGEEEGTVPSLVSELMLKPFRQ